MTGATTTGGAPDGGAGTAGYREAEPVRLAAGHAAALLAFERENRAWFAASVPDRGDAYFASFAERHAALLAEQEAGLCRFHLLFDADGAVLGRINLVDLADGGAELGYRLAERATGRGLATAAVRRICVRAAEDYGLTHLTAVTTEDNTASQRVLLRAGFAITGPATVAGRPGTAYRKELTAPAPEPR
ncbi:GNAT family N-acetyltransferase [Streptomyces sp. NPDC097619]|uniref:GNAT family N-acetyltransferase n=1 Tax=Streptomyces sp. NPDC097619 TaxID=3157228 RepID=UPI00332842A2